MAGHGGKGGIACLAIRRPVGGETGAARALIEHLVRTSSV